MSHKTGKRVLTASSTIALAAVGLVAMPAQAVTQAALGTAVYSNACGNLQDTVQVPTDGYKYFYSTDGGAHLTAITADTNPADGKIDALVIPAAAYTVDLDGAGPNTTMGLSPNFHIYGGSDVAGADAVAVAETGRDTIDNKKCTVAITEAMMPVVTEKTNGQAGGTITLKKVEGVKYVVTGTTDADGTYNSSEMTADKVLTTASGTATVAASAETADYITSPATTTWTLTLDGYSDIALPLSAPVKNDNNGTANDSVTLPSISGVQWYMTETTAPASAAAAKNGMPVAAGTWKALASGVDYYFTAVPATAGVKFADGTDYKNFGPYNFSGKTTIEVKVADIVFQDKDGSVADGIIVPSVAGVTFFYNCQASAPNAVAPTGTNVTKADMVAAGGWTEVAQDMEGRLITGSFTSKQCTVQAILDDPANTQFKTSSDGVFPASQTGGTFIKKSGTYSSTTVVTPAEPVAVDGNGTADSYTFPVFDSRLNYAYKVADSDTTGLAAKPVDLAWSGKTFTRDQWAATFGLDFPPLSTTNTTSASFIDYMRDAGIVITLTPTVKDSAATALPAGFSAAAKPWVSTFTVGSQAAAVSPTFQDQSGTASDGVIYNKVDGVQYRYSTTSFAAAKTGTIVPADWYGQLRLVDPNTTLYVVAEAVNGGTLTNAQSADGFAYFSHQYTSGTVVTAGAPTKVADLSGTKDDTFMVPVQAGVEYFADGVRIDPATYGKPISTKGKASIVITAQGVNGTVLDPATTSSWTLTFDTKESTVGTPVVTHTDDKSYYKPRVVLNWSADKATSYDVAFTVIKADGTETERMNWLPGTTLTSSGFVGGAGQKYNIYVTGIGADGTKSTETKHEVSFVGFPAPAPRTWVDIWNTTTTFTGKTWLGNVPHNYYKNTVAAVSTGSATFTVPAGAKSIQVYGGVHAQGGKALIQINGQNWADLQTNTSYWGQSTYPYQVELRYLTGFDNTKPVTVRIVSQNVGDQYLALDAYSYTM